VSKKAVPASSGAWSYCLLLFTVLSFCGDALACSCSRRTAHDNYREADAVFVGKAVSRTWVGSRMRFQIEESFWGTKGNTVDVEYFDPIQCDSFAFAPGRRYLVVAYRREGNQLSVGICNQSFTENGANADIRVLRARRQGENVP
jgi:hypothetical protein